MYGDADLCTPCLVFCSFLPHV